MKFDFLNEHEIKKIILESKFVVNKEIYRSTFYRKENVRNVIFDGSFDNKKAILKIWKDPREVLEPLMLENFLKNNKSDILSAPKLYSFKLFSNNHGWMIEEKINTNKNIFAGIPDDIERENFMKVFQEYKNNWPKFSKKVYKDNDVAAWAKRHFKIYKSLALDKNILSKDDYVLCEQGLKILEKNGNNYKLIWTHGHFKPKEIFEINPPTSFGTSVDKYYLTDFAHCCWQPDFTEWPFVVWAILKDLHKKISFFEGLNETLKWQKLFIDNNLADEKGFVLGMISRCYGTILADIGGSDYYEKEKQIALDFWKQMLKYFIDNIK